MSHLDCLSPHRLRNCELANLRGSKWSDSLGVRIREEETGDGEKNCVVNRDPIFKKKKTNRGTQY